VHEVLEEELIEGVVELRELVEDHCEW